MGKMKIGIYWYFIADIFDKSFLEMFVEWSSIKHILSYQNLSIWLVVMATERLNMQKLFKIKSTLQKLYGR